MSDNPTFPSGSSAGEPYLGRAARLLVEVRSMRMRARGLP